MQEKTNKEAPLADWPSLEWDQWKATCETLHMWTQIAGKVKLKLAPFWNEWWEVGFEVGARGLTTGLIPAGDHAFEMRFDFLAHELRFDLTDGKSSSLALAPRSVADFYSEFFSILRSLGIRVEINTLPVETVPRIPFEKDTLHASYDPDSVQRWWRILVETARVLQRYRSRFVGKSSPILFFWGSFDLSHTRFSGRPAAMPSVGPRFYRIGEDQENVGCGFWPGNTNAFGVTYGAAAFYSYAYPAPRGYGSAKIGPEKAYFDQRLMEYVLRYEDVRNSEFPEEALFSFFNSTYGEAARLAGWDRPNLEQSLETLEARARRAA